MIPQVQNHAPVTVAVFASAVASVIIAFAKAKWGVDFSGQEANLQVIATGIGYMVASKGAA